MGLSIEETHLTRNGTVFGGIIFHDGAVRYFDHEYNCWDSFFAPAGTILVDPEIYFLRTLGSWHNTVIHECVHWKRHKKVFDLEKLCDGSADRILCRVAEGTADEQGRSDTGWMEWHANSIAPRVLMPRKMFKHMADVFIAKHQEKKRTKKIAAVIPAVIDELAEFFGVSVQAAKIRMIDIGYNEAIGVYEYVDYRYVPSYSFDDKTISRKQTFSIPVTDALFQYDHNADFRRLIDTGCFVYVDAHYCLDDPKYITRNKYGVVAMTEYAVSHIDECCLVFNRAIRPNAAFSVIEYTNTRCSKTRYQRTSPNTNTDTETRTKGLKRGRRNLKRKSRTQRGSSTPCPARSASRLFI